MIFILSTAINSNISLTLDYISKKNGTFFCFFSMEQKLNGISSTVILNSKKQKIYINDKKLLNDKNSFWYRGGDFPYSLPFGLSKINKDLIKIMEQEVSISLNFLHFILQNYLRSIGGYKQEVFTNKITNLYNTSKLNIDIPETIIVSSKKDLIAFSKNKKLITKSLFNHFSIKSEKVNYTGGIPNLINQEDIDKLESNFLPILAQEFLDKSYEIRSFYLKEKFYSMAIFSQNNENTKLDYRNYDRENPNRNVPVKLPKEVESKLKKFMEISELDTGSIDIIVTPDGRYFFLEVNPVGQFGWLSVNCNYYLEEKIANYLAHGQAS